MYKKLSIIAGTLVLAMSTGQSAEALVLDFSSQVGVPGVTFLPGQEPAKNIEESGSFFFGNEGDASEDLYDDFSITNSDGSGSAVGYTGDLEGAFYFDYIEAFGAGQIAEVYGEGIVRIYDSVGGGLLTATITWESIQSQPTLGSTNVYGTVNLEMISNTFTYGDFAALQPPTTGIITTTFSFALPAPSLSQLASEGGSVGNYSGQMYIEASPQPMIPEPASLVLLGLGVVGIALKKRDRLV